MKILDGRDKFSKYAIRGGEMPPPRNPATFSFFGSTPYRVVFFIQNQDDMAENVDIGDKSIVVAGGGLAGGLLACYLRQRGLNVHVVERRPDPRSHIVDGGRSINLALSERGINALRGIGLLNEILDITIPMYGRAIHAVGTPYSFTGHIPNPIYWNPVFQPFRVISPASNPTLSSKTHKFLFSAFQIP